MTKARKLGDNEQDIVLVISVHKIEDAINAERAISEIDEFLADPTGDHDWFPV